MISLKSNPDRSIPSQKAPVVFDSTDDLDQMEAKSKAHYLAEKNKKKAMIMVVISMLLLALYTIFFLYQNASTYYKAAGQIESINQEIALYDQEILPALEAQKNLKRAAFDEDFQQLNQALEETLPNEAEKLEIVRLLESFSSEVAFTSPPFEFNAITFGAEQQMDGYTIIPVSTSIHSSQDAFSNFLALVDRSGLIYTDSSQADILDNVVRLMSISSININYRGVDEETGRDEGLDFSVKLNVYYVPDTLNPNSNS